MSREINPNTILRKAAGLINVYFMKVDTSGHSAIVRQNPHDKVNKLFDLIEEAVYETVEANRKLYDCRYADFWGWQGDGGLCVFYDDTHESRANTAALESGISIIEHRLASLRDALAKQQILGNLHLRIAIHKGAFTFKESRGSIHSRDLNFVAHLETVAPKDTVVISRDVFEASSQALKDSFTRVDFEFEGREVYAYKKGFSSATAFEWMNAIPIQGTFMMNAFPERPTESNKAMMIRHATREVVDLGTALNTCSNYLITRAKPGAYREHVLELLNRGVDYVCLVLDPRAEIASAYEKARGEKLVTKIGQSLERLESFAGDVQNRPGKFKVFAYDALPHFACIGIDRHGEGLFLVSPYMPSAGDLKLERGDSMHYLLRKDQNEGLYGQLNAWIDYYLDNRRSRQLV